ncbi:MAG: SDR family NAD(P)-dependent oxidoreductase [Chloroflexi bacterium]|nr:SDR family NAD(P)-dependent oxidoreductase [Chloroflexota bacterium]
MLLDGKSAIVTGSSRGLGRAYAMLMAKEGANVVVNGTVPADVARVVDEIKAAGGKAISCIESVTTMAGGQRIIQSALDAFGHLDILVNNAGVLRDRTFLNMSEDDWDTVVAVHLKGHFACTKAAAQVMSQQGSGHIINITSRSAWKPPIGQSNYAAVKAGIIGFTIALSQELARYNITVNTIWPTGLTRMNIPVVERRLQVGREEALKKNLPAPTALDLGYGEPEMVAPLIVFLASDEAKDITGKIFRLGGEELAVYSRNVELASGTMRGGWTVEELRKRFKVTFRKAL